jgi:hypothetical protein
MNKLNKLKVGQTIYAVIADFSKSPTPVFFTQAIFIKRNKHNQAGGACVIRDWGLDYVNFILEISSTTTVFHSRRKAERYRKECSRYA